MVSPLKFMRQDPNKTKSRNRGAGYYYKRNSYKRGWFSKYSDKRDGMIKSEKTKFTKSYRHTGDARPSMKTRKHIGRKYFKGFF